MLDSYSIKQDFGLIINIHFNFMCMNDLLNTRFFGLLTEASQETTNEEMQNAYGNFMEHLKEVSDSYDNATALRTLNITRIELATLETFHQYEQGKNALKLMYLHKTLSFVDSELSLIHLRIEHPEQFQQSEHPTFESDLYILPKSKDLGIVALAEIIVALFLSKKVFQRNEKNAHLNQIADAFQKMFNCNFGSIYDQQEKVFDRKPFNRTKALDFLRNLIIQKEKEERNKQNEK